MTNTKLLFFLAPLFVVEATINICIPLHSSGVEASDPYDLFEGIKNDIVTKLSYLYLDHIDANISHPAIRILGTFDDVYIYHLHDFDICFLENLYLNTTTHEYHFDVFNLTYPNLRIEGKYNLTGDIGDLFDIYGVGNFWAEMVNLSVAMTDFTINVTEEICLPVNIEINLQEMRNHFYKFMDDPDLEKLLNGAMSSILPESFKIIWSEMKDIFDKPLEDEINNMIHHRKVSVFGLLKSFVKSAPYCYSTYQEKLPYGNLSS